MRSMKMLHSIAVVLQQDTITISKTRCYIRHSDYEFSGASKMSQDYVPTVFDVAFVYGIKKIQQKRCPDLYKAKTVAVKLLQKGS